MLDTLEVGRASLEKFKRYRTLVKEIERLLEQSYRSAPSSASVYNKGMEIQAKVYQSHDRFNRLFSEFIDASKPHIEKAADGEMTEEEMAKEVSAVASSVTRSGTIDTLIAEVDALREKAAALLDGVRGEV